MNRRHHAQPICCPECGPTITLHNHSGESLAENQTAITRTTELIKQGNIRWQLKESAASIQLVMLFKKGLLRRLRLRKRRPQKPLAVMVKSLEAASDVRHISSSEEDFLKSPEKPIVILKKRREDALPQNISPGLSTIGVMLPYTLLHHLLFKENQLECIVLTSANPSGLPILYKDEDLKYVQNICDYTLTHNRKMDFPIDDSVIQCNGEQPVFVRRARGYVPEPLKTASGVGTE